MPNHYSHTIYKEYVETQLNESKRDQASNESVMDEIEDQIT